MLIAVFQFLFIQMIILTVFIFINNLKPKLYFKNKIFNNKNKNLSIRFLFFFIISIRGVLSSSIPGSLNQKTDFGFIKTIEIVLNSIPIWVYISAIFLLLIIDILLIIYIVKYLYKRSEAQDNGLQNNISLVEDIKNFEISENTNFSLQDISISDNSEELSS
ncbi:hypothetical protein CDIK_4396, partial [Cucumispora dikerogammari]